MDQSDSAQMQMSWNSNITNWRFTVVNIRVQLQCTFETPDSLDLYSFVRHFLTARLTLLRLALLCTGFVA